MEFTYTANHFPSHHLFPVDAATVFAETYCSAKLFQLLCGLAVLGHAPGLSSAESLQLHFSCGPQYPHVLLTTVAFRFGNQASRGMHFEVHFMSGKILS
jgi:hypothetical protein